MKSINLAIRMEKNLIVAVLAGLALQGCASVGVIEAQQLAYTGSGENHCRWGGVTEKAEAHCAELRWGLEGYLMAVNRAVIKDLPVTEDSNPCQAHVARLQEILRARPELQTQVVYSCPKGLADCHVSLMVSEASGNRFVLDNGAVMTSGDALDGVGSLQQFASLVDDDYRLIAGPGKPSQIMLAAP